MPLQAMVDRAAAGIYKAKPARVFAFEEIQEAHRVMEANQANGKLVVRVGYGFGAARVVGTGYAGDSGRRLDFPSAAPV